MQLYRSDLLDYDIAVRAYLACVDDYIRNAEADTKRIGEAVNKLRDQALRYR